MAFSTTHPRLAQDMKVYAEATRTAEFLGIDISGMKDSQECHIALKGVTVQHDGLHFMGGQAEQVISDEDLATALRLREQLPHYDPGGGPTDLLSYGMLRGLEAQTEPRLPDRDLVRHSLPHTAWNHNLGRKVWIMRMQERIFLSKKASSITTGNLRILYDITENPERLLGYWKLGMHQVPPEKRVLHSTFNLMMGYVLRHTLRGKAVGRGKPDESPASLTRAAAMRHAASFRPPGRAAHTEATAPEWREKRAGRKMPPYSKTFLQDLLLRTWDPPAQYRDLLEDFHEGVTMGLTEVERLAGQVDGERTLRIQAEEANERNCLQPQLERSKLSMANDGKADAEATLAATLQNHTTLLQERDDTIAAQSHAAQKGKEDLKQLRLQEAKAREETTLVTRQLAELREAKTEVDREVEQAKDSLETQRVRILELEATAAATAEQVRVLEATPKASPEEMMAIREKLATAEAAAEGWKTAKGTLEAELESAKEGLESKEEEVRYWKGQNGFLTRVSRTPEQRRALLSGKKRKVETVVDGRLSDADLAKVIDEVQQKVTAELETRVEQLCAYQELVRQSALDELSYAASRASHKGATVEEYYQIMNLLVDSYRTALGIEQTHLSDRQWAQLLRDMPMEGKEVIPRMLMEQRLTAENPEVCNLLLGGLVNLQASYMMTAQYWAMGSQQEPRDLVPLVGNPVLTDEAADGWKAQGRTTRDYLEIQRQRRDEFLGRLDWEEAENKVVIGSRRVRWAFHQAGWDREGDLRLGGLDVPRWMVDYAMDPPKEYVEGMFPLTAPDPRSMRIIEQTIDLGQYLPHQQLLLELERPRGRVWDGLGPSEELMRWLEFCIDARPDLSHFGDGLPLQFCKDRREAQRVFASTFRGEDAVCLPSIYAGGLKCAPTIPLTPNADRQKMLLELRLFYGSFHEGRPNSGALRDPRVLVAYVVARGLAMLLAMKLVRVENFELFRGVDGGGWTLYALACGISPMMVRWLAWVGRTGYLPGLHANLVNSVDDSAMYQMLDAHWQAQRQTIGFRPTATRAGMHHDIHRPPQLSSSHPKTETQEDDMKLDASIQISKLDKRLAKTGQRIVSKCLRHPDQDAQPKKKKNNNKSEDDDSDGNSEYQYPYQIAMPRSD